MAIHDEMDRAISDGDQLSDGYFNALATLVPIGAIIPWAKSFTNVPALPDGWLECDGSVISDATSPINGETLPDLNGNNRFMRGNSTSGGTGGSATMAHTHGNPGNWTVTIDGADKRFSQVTGGASDTENRPPFYDCVWIMRIK